MCDTCGCNITQGNEHLISPGGKLEKLYPLFEATDTFLYTTDEVTTVGPHVRDSNNVPAI